MLSMPTQWRNNPKPDESVIALTGAVDEASNKGQVRSVAIVTVNPNLEVEFVSAGELDEVRKNLLIAGLNRLIRKLSD
jgi:hypothetical protein